MISKFFTEVSTKFNPFKAHSKPCRTFLAYLPVNARQTMKINVKVLPRDSTESGFLNVKFKDGKEMQWDTSAITIQDIKDDVGRHSRMLNRKEELTGS